MTAAAEVVQATAWYGPAHVGGTEVYVEALVEELSRRGVRSRVLTPSHETGPAGYERAGADVETYPVNRTATRAELAEGAAHEGFGAFRRALEGRRGAIYHQHSWTRGLGLPHLQAARETGLRTVLTVHVASNICLRGTMRRFGREACDGPTDAATCGACRVQERGLLRPLARAASRLPLAVAQRGRRGHGRGNVALATRVIGEEKLRAIGQMIEAADRIVAPCVWLFDALVAGGAPRRKLVLSRQGVSRGLLVDCVARQRAHGRRQQLRLIYVGSYDPGKGLATAINAIRRLPPETTLHLTVHAPSRPYHRDAENDLRLLAGRDDRIRLAGSLSRDALGDALAAHDAMVVPSLVLETGPMVMLEAHAAGLVVLGSRLGGIAELASRDDVLIEPGDTQAWAAAIGALADRVVREGALPHRRKPVRTMAEVADDMLAIYRTL